MHSKKKSATQIWDDQILYALKKKGISEDTKSKWIDALNFLRTELGESFLKSSIENSNKYPRQYHPIYQKIINSAHIQILDLISFTQIIQKLKSQDCNDEKLKNKLTRIIDCGNEGIPFVDISSFFMNNFDILFIEEKDHKTPDIKLSHKHTKEQIFIEVSKLGPSDESEKYCKNYEHISQKLDSELPYLPFSCIQLRYILDSEMAELMKKIEEIKQVVSINENIEFYKDDKIDLVISHNSKEIEFKEWCKSNDRSDELIGLDINLNETNRVINNKIAFKAKKFSVDTPGLIFIPISALHFLVADIEETVNALVYSMQKFPNVLGVVIWGSFIESGEEEIKEDENYLFRKKVTNEMFMQYLLCVFNNVYNVPISLEVLNAIKSSLR